MKTKGSFVFVMVVLLSLLVSSCAAPATQAPTQAPKPTTPPAPASIEIGASIPLTGKYGSLGSQVKAGYEYAVADINAAGGVEVAQYGKKIPLHLTIYDDESDPTKAVSKLESLYSEQKVTAYLGGAASDMHAATSAIAEKNKVPYLGISFALWKIHQQGYKYLFSPFVKSPDQANDVFAFLNGALAEANRPYKVAIFQESTDWGEELGALWVSNAAKYGYKIVVHEKYAPSTKDYSAMILKAKAAGAETLLAMPSGPDGMAIVKQLSELGWTPKFTMMVRGPDGNSWGQSLGKLGDYITFLPGWHYGEKYAGVAEINAKHQKDFGRPADVLVGPAYACVQILADAIKRAGKLDRDAIRDAIAATNMMTVEGTVTFRADGTGVVLDPVCQWLNGKQELVWPKDHATTAFVYPAPDFAKR